MTVDEYLQCSEFYTLIKHSTVDHMQLACDLYKFQTLQQYRKRGKSPLAISNAHALALIGIFNAGRITGIREERAKKKKKGQHKADQ